VNEAELPTGAAKEFFVVSFDYADKRYMVRACGCCRHEATIGD